MLKDGHVRVDIFYRSASSRQQAWVDLTGTVVFLIPYIVVLMVWSWDYGPDRGALARAPAIPM